MKNQNKKNVLGRVLGYLKPYKITFISVIILASLSTVFSVLTPSVTGGITTELYEGVKSGSFDWEKIALLLVSVVVLYLISQLFGVLQSFWMAKITAKVVQKMRDDIAEKMQKIKLNYYDTRTKGEILSAITNDVDTVSTMISQNFTSVVTNMITAIGVLIIMFSINKVLAVIAIVMVPVSLAASMGVMVASGKHFSRQQELIGNLNGYIEEMYQGQSLVQSFNYQTRAKEGFDELNDALTETARNAEVASGSIMPITSLVNNAGYVISAILGCMYAISGRMTVGNVQAMLQYTKQFSQPFTTIAGMASSFGASMAAAKRVFELLDAEEELPDTGNSIRPSKNDGAVVFQHVSFGYTPDHLLMKDVNIEVKAGQKVAIVGPTGAGKTTLINLLMRFYEVNGGEILVDGVNTRDMTREELRKHFGMVLQDTWLFEGSIKENLAYSRDGLMDEEIISASKAASADGFIRTLPGGYDMKLTHGAENISQGERQLLTIARAMAANPEIMILDEATSNVDTHTEQKIQNAMKELMKGRTSFVIAHRLATIIDADMILYMENGDIKEVGNHETLMALNGKYTALYNSQFA